MILEPCAARAAGVAHNPPLDRQASWHQCPTECQRVEQLVSTDCGKRMKNKKISSREPCAARTNWLSATRDTPRPGPTYGQRQDSFLHSTPTRSSTRSRTCCPTLDSSLSPGTPRKQTQPNADAGQPNHTPLENPSNEERNGYVSPFHFTHLLNLGLMWDRSGAIWRGRRGARCGGKGPWHVAQVVGVQKRGVCL